MTHPQSHQRSFSYPMHAIDHITIQTSPISPVVSFSQELSVDQFWSEEHNLKDGFVDTSPAKFDDSSFASHIMPVSPEKPLPSDMSVDDIHNMVVSRKCETIAELSALKKYMPNKSDYVEKVTDDIVDNPSTESAVS